MSKAKYVTQGPYPSCLRMLCKGSSCWSLLTPTSYAEKQVSSVLLLGGSVLWHSLEQPVTLCFYQQENLPLQDDSGQ